MTPAERRSGAYLLALLVSMAFTLHAQVTTANASGQRFVPAVTNIRTSDYPQVDSAGDATFRLAAPLAKQVELEGGPGLGKGPFPLAKDGDGLWMVTVSKAVPGFHYFWYMVDGLRVNDPGSKTYFGYDRETSAIEIPEENASYSELQDVPHGEVRRHRYFSRTTQAWRYCVVYTPPAYDTPANTRFPVLYLQHGAGENQDGWTQQGRLDAILDNLIATKAATPMIVVMDLGYADKAGERGTPFRGLASSVQGFQAVLLNDLIPNIDQTYRTLADREHRALAGLSMGGMQALYIGLQNKQTFSYIGSLSGPMLGTIPSRQKKIGMAENVGTVSSPLATTPQAQKSSRVLETPFAVKESYGGTFADPQTFNSQVHLLWFGVGTEEGEFNEAIRSGVSALREQGIKSEIFVSPGTAHEWLTWRRCLANFAPLLFRQ